MSSSQKVVTFSKTVSQFLFVNDREKVGLGFIDKPILVQADYSKEAKVKPKILLGLQKSKNPISKKVIDIAVNRAYLIAKFLETNLIFESLFEGEPSEALPQDTPDEDTSGEDTSDENDENIFKATKKKLRLLGGVQRVVIGDDSKNFIESDPEAHGHFLCRKGKVLDRRFDYLKAYKSVKDFYTPLTSDGSKGRTTFCLPSTFETCDYDLEHPDIRKIDVEALRALVSYRGSTR